MLSNLLPKFLATLLLLALPLGAQEVGDAPPPAKKPGVQILFLPPPLQGTVSVGLFNPKGKLVRVLRAEATEKEFVVALNGFIAQWDGRDDAGEALPPGKYNARGFMVGDLEVDGVAFHGNDWITPGDDKKPEAAIRGKRIASLTPGQKGGLIVRVEASEPDAGGKPAGFDFPLFIAPKGTKLPKLTTEAVVADGRLTIRHGGKDTPVELPPGERVVAASVGFGEKVWSIVQTGESPRREVHAYSAKGEFLRRLAYDESEPQPQMIGASGWSDEIVVVEESPTEQRLRALALTTVEKSGTDTTSSWKVTLQKSVLGSATFAEAGTWLKKLKPLKPEATIRLKTLPNPLLNDATEEVELELAYDEEGALLRTADGLPLIHLTSTPNLLWAVMAHEGEHLTMLQGDGAVVEEFKIGKPGNLMSFEAGEYELVEPAPDTAEGEK